MVDIEERYKDLIDFGFKEVNDSIMVGLLYYYIKQNVTISVSDLGTPKEYVYIAEQEFKNIIILHRYEVDGYYITNEKIKDMVTVLKS